jgi:flagellar hook capping protein FlgD
MIAPRFDLPRLETPQGAISGQILGYNPLADAMPQPLEGATIVAMPLFPSATTYVLMTHTAADGTFHLEVPADTPYRVFASADGYESLYFQNAMNYPDATPVDVTPGQTTPGIDFSLPQTLPGSDKGAIEGLVLRRTSEDCSTPDPNGSINDSCLVPAAGALIRITPAYPTLVAVEYRTYTGPDGRFRIDGLTAQADGYLSYYVSAQLNNEEPAYYPGGVPFSEAQSLPVFPGQTSDAGTIVVPGKLSGGPGFLAGNVTDPDNHPIDHALVRVFVQPDSPWGQVARAFSNTDGSFYVGELPAGASVIVSAEANGYVPAYYPYAYQWTQAERVLVSESGGLRDRGPVVAQPPLHITLGPAATGGPFIQAGLVVVKPESVIADTGWVDPTPLSTRKTAPASILERFGALAYEMGLRDAFFYVVNAAAMSPTDIPVSGASTGDNGASILRGLHEGTYIAYADRPGFDKAYFSDTADHPVLITLNDSTPAVLAWIALYPRDGGYVGPPGQDSAMLHNLTNVPNPFGAQTAIRYTLRSQAPVTVQVFDHSGRLVRTIVRSNQQASGPHEVSWDARDDSGRRVTKGIYFTRVLAGPEAFARKMLLLP